MQPRHQLIVSVAIVAAVIAVAWIMLFQRNILTPPMTALTGPSLPELGKEFDAGIEQFNRLLVPAMNAPPVNAAPVPGTVSDDVRAPTPP